MSPCEVSLNIRKKGIGAWSRDLNTVFGGGTITLGPPLNKYPRFVTDMSLKVFTLTRQLNLVLVK